MLPCNNTMNPDDIVVLGRIISPFGIKGWVKIRPDTAKVDALSGYAENLYWFKDGSWQLAKIEQQHPRGEVVHAKFKDINDRDQAVGLRGYLLGVPRKLLPKVQDDEYYWVDLIGLVVYNKKNEFLGNVVDLLETGPHSVLVIDAQDHEDLQRLIPFVAVYIVDVDLIKKQIIVDWELDY